MNEFIGASGQQSDGAGGAGVHKGQKDAFQHPYAVLIEKLAPPNWLDKTERTNYIHYANALLQLHHDDNGTEVVDPEDICAYAGIAVVSHASSKLNWAMHLAFLEIYRDRLLAIYGLKYTEMDDFLDMYPHLASQPQQERHNLWAEANWMVIFLRHFGIKKYRKGLLLGVVTKFVEGLECKYVTGGGQKMQTTIRACIWEREGECYRVPAPNGNGSSGTSGTGGSGDGNSNGTDTGPVGIYTKAWGNRMHVEDVPILPTNRDLWGEQWVDGWGGTVSTKRVRIVSFDGEDGMGAGVGVGVGLGVGVGENVAQVSAPPSPLGVTHAGGIHGTGASTGAGAGADAGKPMGQYAPDYVACCTDSNNDNHNDTHHQQQHQYQHPHPHHTDTASAVPHVELREETADSPDCSAPAIATATRGRSGNTALLAVGSTTAAAASGSGPAKITGTSASASGVGAFTRTPSIKTYAHTATNRAKRPRSKSGESAVEAAAVAVAAAVVQAPARPCPPLPLGRSDADMDNAMHVPVSVPVPEFDVAGKRAGLPQDRLGQHQRQHQYQSSGARVGGVYGGDRHPPSSKIDQLGRPGGVVVGLGELGGGQHVPVVIVPQSDVEDGDISHPATSTSVSASAVASTGAAAVGVGRESTVPVRLTPARLTNHEHHAHTGMTVSPPSTPGFRPLTQLQHKSDPCYTTTTTDGRSTPTFHTQHHYNPSANGSGGRGSGRGTSVSRYISWGFAGSHFSAAQDGGGGSSGGVGDGYYLQSPTVPHTPHTTTDSRRSNTGSSGGWGDKPRCFSAPASPFEGPWPLSERRAKHLSQLDLLMPF